MNKMEAEIETPQNEKEQSFEYIYLYGIINKKDAKLKINGLKNNPINKINFKDITALTSSYPILNPALNDEEAVEHANILKEIAKKTTVVPTSFGTVFKDDEILETVLSSSYLAIKQTLALTKGKIELGVKVIKNQLGEVPDGVALEILESLNKLSVKSAKAFFCARMSSADTIESFPPPSSTNALFLREILDRCGFFADVL